METLVLIGFGVFSILFPIILCGGIIFGIMKLFGGKVNNTSSGPSYPASSYPNPYAGHASIREMNEERERNRAWDEKIAQKLKETQEMTNKWDQENREKDRSWREDHERKAERIRQEHKDRHGW